MSSGSTALVRIGDAGLTVPPEQDVRGLDVVDRDGEPLGQVVDLFVDEGEHRVRFLEVGSGGFLGFGEDKRLLPVDTVTRIEDDTVHISTTRTVVAGGPVYDPDVARLDPAAQVGALYGYYGYGPWWGPGYVPPGAFW